MKTTINRYTFSNAFQRAERADQFSIQALHLLFEYFEEYEESTGEEIELDVIAICCDYAEYTLSDVSQNYSIDLEGLEGEDRIEAVINYLEKNTTVIGLVNDETIVYANF